MSSVSVWWSWRNSFANLDNTATHGHVEHADVAITRMNVKFQCKPRISLLAFPKPVLPQRIECSMRSHLRLAQFIILQSSKRFRSSRMTADHRITWPAPIELLCIQVRAVRIHL